jgi:negative regulator of sigma E activity
MSEQEQISQLSALFDDELPPQHAEMVIRRAVKDPAMREHWQRYALIGACLRGEPLVGAHRRDGLAERVRANLAAEADVIAPGAFAAIRSAGSSRRFSGIFGRSVTGGAIAAGVALLSIFVVRSMGPVPGDVGVPDARAQSLELVASSRAAAARQESVSVNDTAPRSYTTPGVDSPVANRPIDQQPLAHYVVAHSEQAASAFGFSYDLTQGAVDMTEAEIEARR